MGASRSFMPMPQLQQALLLTYRATSTLLPRIQVMATQMCPLRSCLSFGFLRMLRLKICALISMVAVWPPKYRAKTNAIFATLTGTQLKHSLHISHPAAHQFSKPQCTANNSIRQSPNLGTMPINRNSLPHKTVEMQLTEQHLAGSIQDRNTGSPRILLTRHL